jgi:hypothetical protein
MKSPFYNPSTALNAVAVAVGPADPPAFKRRSSARPEELDVMGLCSARNFNAATSCAPCDANHGCQGKNVITVCCVKGKYETNKHTNKRTNEQTNKETHVHQTWFFKNKHVSAMARSGSLCHQNGKNIKQIEAYRKTLHI